MSSDLLNLEKVKNTLKDLSLEAKVDLVYVTLAELIERFDARQAFCDDRYITKRSVLTRTVVTVVSIATGMIMMVIYGHFKRG